MSAEGGAKPVSRLEGGARGQSGLCVIGYRRESLGRWDTRVHSDVTDDVPVDRQPVDTWTMQAQRVPRKTRLWGVFRTYPVPWSLFFAAALAFLALALR